VSEILIYLSLGAFAFIVCGYFISHYLEQRDEKREYTKNELYQNLQLRLYQDGRKEIVVHFYQWFFGFKQSKKLREIDQLCKQNEIISFTRGSDSNNVDLYRVEGSNGHWKINPFLYEARFPVSPILIENQIREQNINITQYGNGMINLSISQDNLSALSTIANNNLLSPDDKKFLKSLINDLYNGKNIDTNELSRFSKVLNTIEKYEPAASLINNLAGITEAISKILN